MALTHRRPPWVTDSRHNSKLQPNHTKHKHTNPHTTTLKPATHLTRHHNHNKHTTKKHWTTMQALSSDHLPILITFKTKTNYKIQQHRRTYINYKRASWQEITQETVQTLANTETPQNTHTATKILTPYSPQTNIYQKGKYTKHTNYCQNT